MQKAVFLDRDGVINHDPGDYTYSLKEFKVNDGVYEALEMIRDAGYKMFIITNQGGIEKGRYGHEEVEQIHDYFIKECERRLIYITEVYYCPHHSDLSKCLCRKPGSLFVEKAIAKYSLDPKQSWFIGDKERDVEAGAACGVKGIKIELNTNLKPYIEKYILRNKDE